MPHDLFSDVARQVESRFFTMDVAQTVSGEWMIVELGDGQVAGLPSRADVIKFYRELIQRCGFCYVAGVNFNLSSD